MYRSLSLSSFCNNFSSLLRENSWKKQMVRFPAVDFPLCLFFLEQIKSSLASQQPKTIRQGGSKGWQEWGGEKQFLGPAHDLISSFPSPPYPV